MVKGIVDKNHKKRNQRLNMANAKKEQLNKGFNILPSDSKNIACPHVIDVSKRSPSNKEPKMTN